MNGQREAHIVAEKAREAFLKIRELRKNERQFTRKEKDELEEKIKALHDEWWEDVKGYMKKDYPPFTKDYDITKDKL